MLLSGCTHLVDNYKLSKDPVAYSAKIVLRHNADLVSEILTKLKRCLPQTDEQDIQSLVLKGHIQSIKGDLFFSDMTLEKVSTEFKTVNKTCIDESLKFPHRNIGQGTWMRSEGLSNNDFHYSFEGKIYPTVSGKVIGITVPDQATF